jgi:hypothetical protein
MFMASLSVGLTVGLTAQRAGKFMLGRLVTENWGFNAVFAT